MDSYAITRAESRIRELESELQRLRFDVERKSCDARSEQTRLESDISFWRLIGVLWVVGLWLMTLAEIKTG